MELVLSMVVFKLLMTSGLSNDVMVCKYAGIPVENDENCSTNISHDDTAIKMENNGTIQF